MPGVKAILLPTRFPAPPTSSPTSVQVIKANPHGEKALTNEPVYQGEPMLAVAAVDELTAVEAIENDRHRLGAAAVQRRSDRVAAPGPAECPRGRQRLGASRSRSRASSPAAPDIADAEVDGGRLRRVQPGPAADGQADR